MYSCLSAGFPSFPSPPALLPACLPQPVALAGGLFSHLSARFGKQRGIIIREGALRPPPLPLRAVQQIKEYHRPPAPCPHIWRMATPSHGPPTPSAAAQGGATSARQREQQGKPPQQGNRQQAKTRPRRPRHPRSTPGAHPGRAASQPAPQGFNPDWEAAAARPLALQQAPQAQPGKRSHLCAPALPVQLSSQRAPPQGAALRRRLLGAGPPPKTAINQPTSVPARRRRRCGRAATSPCRAQRSVAQRALLRSAWQ